MSLIEGDKGLKTVEVDISLFYNDKSKNYDFIEELKQLERQGYIVFGSEKDAADAVRRIKKRLIDHGYTIAFKKARKKVMLDGFAIKLK